MDRNVKDESKLIGGKGGKTTREQGRRPHQKGP